MVVLLWEKRIWIPINGLRFDKSWRLELSRSWICRFWIIIRKRILRILNYRYVVFCVRVSRLLIMKKKTNQSTPTAWRVVFINGRRVRYVRYRKWWQWLYTFVSKTSRAEQDHGSRITFWHDEQSTGKFCWSRNDGGWFDIMPSLGLAWLWTRLEGCDDFVVWSWRRRRLGLHEQGLVLDKAITSESQATDIKTEDTSETKWCG